MPTLKPPRIFAGPKLRVARWRRGYLTKINAWEARLRPLTDDELRRQSLALRFRVQSRQPASALLPEAFALVREAARRTIGLRHHDVQMLAAIALYQGSIAELQTGEGKTLAATAPLYLAALRGKGAHLATVNDYLAKRDAEWMGPVYAALGLTVGVVTNDLPSAQRRLAYQRDITYGTAKEFGFDFLRDRMQLAKTRKHDLFLERDAARRGAGLPGEQTMQRSWEFCLIDEADSILIDEARTPLIISGSNDRMTLVRQTCFLWAAQHAKGFDPRIDFTRDAKTRRYELTLQGARCLRALPTPGLETQSQGSLEEALLRAIKVEHEFKRDQHYVVREGKVVIVDEETGRLAEGRQWRDGIHQAIEAKEGLELTAGADHAARVTMHGFFRRYRRLAGMTATASSAAAELRKTYRLGVVRIPTHRPCIRKTLLPVVCRTLEQKWQTVVAEIEALHNQGRPVLVGTRSIERSEHLSRLLKQRGIIHQVLNARNPEQEAAIIADAGQLKKVTVATNMAGRGTDIKLGPGVEELGGLHVICTELNDSARIDRQLQGRCARQGDPGSFRAIVSYQDQVIVESSGKLPSVTPVGPRTRARASHDLAGDAAFATEIDQEPQRKRSGYGTIRRFLRAQRRIEQRHYKQRKALLYFSAQGEKAPEGTMATHSSQTPYKTLV